MSKEVVDFIEKHTAEEGSGAKNWNFVAERLYDEYAIIIGRRATHKETRTSMFIHSLFAAELFCDEIPPRLLVAKSKAETHEDLREQFPSVSPRVSGNVFHIHEFSFKFFSMDCVVLKGNIKLLPTKNQLTEVARWLISQNIVPLDAQMMIISA